MSVLILVPYCFDYCSFVESFEIRICGSSNFVGVFVCFFNMVLVFVGLLGLHMNLTLGFSIFAEKTTEILIQIALNL